MLTLFCSKNIHISADPLSRNNRHPWQCKKRNGIKWEDEHQVPYFPPKTCPSPLILPISVNGNSIFLIVQNISHPWLNSLSFTPHNSKFCWLYCWDRSQTCPFPPDPLPQPWSQPPGCLAWIIATASWFPTLGPIPSAVYVLPRFQMNLFKNQIYIMSYFI